MDLMESFRTLGRHWILTSVLLLLTLAGTAAGFVKLPWTYQTESQVVLLNSKTASLATGGNKYLAFDESLTEAADVLSIEATDPRVVQDLSARGYSASYTVVVSSATGGPILLVTVDGHNKAAVEHTIYGVTNEIFGLLRNIQAGVSAKNQITMQLITLDSNATRSITKKAKPLVVVLALGLVLTFTIPQTVDARISKRRSRRRRLAGQQGPDQSLGRLESDPLVAGIHAEQVTSRSSGG